MDAELLKEFTTFVTTVTRLRNLTTIPNADTIIDACNLEIASRKQQLILGTTITTILKDMTTLSKTLPNNSNQTIDIAAFVAQMRAYVNDLMGAINTLEACK